MKRVESVQVTFPPLIRMNPMSQMSFSSRHHKYFVYFCSENQISFPWPHFSFLFFFAQFEPMCECAFSSFFTLSSVDNLCRPVQIVLLQFDGRKTWKVCLVTKEMEHFMIFFIYLFFPWKEMNNDNLQRDAYLFILQRASICLFSFPHIWKRRLSLFIRVCRHCMMICFHLLYTLYIQCV